MLSLSREKIYKGLGARPIAYVYVIAKGLRPRPYALKRLSKSQLFTNMHMRSAETQAEEQFSFGLGFQVACHNVNKY